MTAATPAFRHRAPTPGRHRGAAGSTQEVTPAVAMEHLAAFGALAVALASQAVISPRLLPVALLVGALTAALAYSATQRIPIGVASAGLAMLLVPGTATGLAMALLLGATLAAVLTRTPYPFLIGGLGLVWGHPAAAALLGFTIAALIAWPDPEPRGPAWDRARLAAGIVLAGLGVLLGAIPWAGPAGLAAGLLARTLDRHPANRHIAHAIRQAALWLALLPALLLFLLAAVGRFPPLSPLRVVLVAWGALGVGILILLLGRGIATLYRATGAWAGLATASALAFALLVAVGVFTAALPGAAAGLVGWGLLAPWIALGALHRQAHAWLGSLALLLGALTTPALRLLMVT